MNAPRRDLHARSGAILPTILAIAIATGLAALAPQSVTAQYLYLDANGDSLNTGWEWPDPDTATVDLYIKTDATLSGEPPVCASGDGTLELWQYSVAIESYFGSLTLLSVENSEPGMTEAFPPEIHPYGLTFGYTGRSVLSPGRHRLLRLRLLGAGCSLEIVPTSCHNLPGVTTSMTAYCPDTGGEYTLPLEGQGTTYCTDPPNLRPTVSAPDTIRGVEEEPISFKVDITDPECGEGTYLFAFYALDLPSGAVAGPLSQWAYGATTSTFSWTPALGQAGTYAVRFVVHDPDTWNWWIPPDVETATIITVAPATPISVQGEPTAHAGGPYSGQIGSPIRFDGAGSSDSEAGTLVYSWSFGDAKSAQGRTVEHFYEHAGSYRVALTVTNPGGLSDTDITTASISDTPPAGRSLLGPIAPNPVTTGSVVAFTTTRDGAVSLRLFDARGRVVASIFETTGIGAGTHRVNAFGPGTPAGSLPSGIYFLQLHTQHDGEVTRRITLIR